ncbi:MAG: tetratricopeptide repeat protein [Desulfobacterales bacterium]|nr:tetratricopeptide repeat protein [Desulfobacterales bacterium]
MAPPQIAALLNIPLDTVRAQLDKSGATSFLRDDAPVYGPCYTVFLLVLFLGPLIFSNLFYEFENAPRSLLIQAGALLIPLLWLLRPRKAHTLEIVAGPVFRPLLLLAAWSLVSISWSTYRYGAFSQWVHWAACGLFYGISYNLHPHGKAIRLTLHVVMATAGLIAALGILQYLGGLDWVPQQVAPAATFNNKNMAAQFMVLTFPVSLVLAATSPDKRLTWVYALVTSLAVLFLFYTRTRAAWLAALFETLLICGGLWLYRKRLEPKQLFDKNRSLALVAALAVLFACMQLGPGFLNSGTAPAPQPAARKLGDNLDLSSGRHRVVLWKNTLSVITRHPVAGVGIRNLQVHYPTTPDKSYHRLNLHTQRVHNDYLQMYAELGLPFLICFGWTVVLIIRAAVAIGRSPDNAAWIPSALICLAAIFGLAINAVFSFPFNRALPPFLLAVYLGMFFKIAALASAQTGQPPAGKVLKQKTALALAGVWGVLVVAWGFTGYNWARADHFYRKHVIAFLGHDYARAVSYGNRALEYNPARGAILRSLSRVYVRQKDYANAEALFARVDRVFPHAPLNLYHQAVARINQGRLEDAEKTIRKGLAVIPQSGKLQGLLGVVYQAWNRVEDALDAYRQAVTLSPHVGDHYQWLSQLLYEQKRFKEAMPVLKRWIEIDPENVDGHVKLGLIFLNRKELPPAENHFRKAVQLSQDSAILHRYLGVALTHQEKLDEAVLEFQAAVVKSRGRDAAAHNNLGSVLARQGRFAEAVGHFREALKIDPDYKEARKNLERAERLQKSSE